MKTRKYTAQEIHDIMSMKEVRDWTIRFDPHQDDFRYEDTEELLISLPRGIWRIVQDAAKDCECSIDAMVSDMVCNNVWDVLKRSMT